MVSILNSKEVGSFKRVAKGLKKGSKTIALYEWSLDFGSKREQDGLSIIDLIGIWARYPEKF